MCKTTERTNQRIWRDTELSLHSSLAENASCYLARERHILITSLPGKAMVGDVELDVLADAESQSAAPEHTAEARSYASDHGRAFVMNSHHSSKSSIHPLGEHKRERLLCGGIVVVQPACL